MVENQCVAPQPPYVGNKILFFTSRSIPKILRKKPVEQSAAIFSWFYKGRGGRFEAPRGLTLFPTPIHSTSPSHSVCSKRYFRPDSFTGFSLSHAFSLFRYLLLSLLFCLYVIKTFCKSQEKPVRFFSFSLALLHCARERNGLITIHNSQTLNGLQPSKKKERKLFPPLSLLWLVSFSLSSPHGSVSKKTVARLCGEQWRTRLNL